MTGTIVTVDRPAGTHGGPRRRDRADPRGQRGRRSRPRTRPPTPALIQIVPETGPRRPGDRALVRDLRAEHDRLLDEYGVDLKVTGFTAVGIDISDRLGAALLPFGAVRRRALAHPAHDGVPLDLGADQGRRSATCCPSPRRSASSPRCSSGAGSPTCCTSTAPARSSASCRSSSWACCSAWRWTTRCSSCRRMREDYVHRPRRAGRADRAPGASSAPATRRHRGRRHHVRRLRRLRPRGRRLDQADRARPRRRRLRRRLPRAHDPRARGAWRCSARRRGGCRAGSTASCPTFDIEGEGRATASSRSRTGPRMPRPRRSSAKGWRYAPMRAGASARSRCSRMPTSG